MSYVWLQGPPGDMGVSGQSGKPGEKVRPVFNCVCVCMCVCVCVCDTVHFTAQLHK